MIKKKDVKIGGYYVIKHTSSTTGRLNVIRIEGECQYGGWNATNLKTGRLIRIRSNTKLRGEVRLNPEWATGTNIPKWLKVEAA